MFRFLQQFGQSGCPGPCVLLPVAAALELERVYARQFLRNMIAREKIPKLKNAIESLARRKVLENIKFYYAVGSGKGN